MDSMEIAKRARVDLTDIESLFQGRATKKVADRLGVSMKDIEAFIQGSASAGMTERLGLTAMSAAEELVKVAGRNAAIGFLIGLLFAPTKPNP